MKLLVFLGSSRDSTPPSPARLGERVARACVAALSTEHEVKLIDPLDVPHDTTFKPYFAYARGKAAVELTELAAKIEAADGYVMVSPEYNHAMSPALADLLNHFGASLFAFKPSLIVTYSAGQWGGTRAAVNMRSFLSELGCLPVSAMVHVPKAQEVFDAQGEYLDGVDAERWQGYFGRGLAQLGWWAEAASQQRRQIDPHTLSPAFRQNPSQRNAPDNSA